MASDPNSPFKRAGDALRRASSEATENSHQISLKLIEQAERNTREVFATLREIAKASNPADVVKIQGEFVREQGSRAVEHAKEIGELIAQFGRSAVSSITDPGDKSGQ
jgi:phasin family protein